MAKFVKVVVTAQYEEVIAVASLGLNEEMDEDELHDVVYDRCPSLFREAVTDNYVDILSSVVQVLGNE